MNTYNFEIDDKRSKYIVDILKQKGMGKEMPMLSIPFIDWFKSYDFSEYSMVEIGSGYSTEFFFNKVKNFISFEPHFRFYRFMKDNLDNTVNINFIQMKDLIRGNFNIDFKDRVIVFVDNDFNRYRPAVHAIEKCNPDIVILDNSEHMIETCKYIYSKGYIEIPFWGIRPEGPVEKCTSVFIKVGSSLPSKNYSFFAEGSDPSRVNKFELLPDHILDIIIDGHEKSEAEGLPCNCNEIFKKIEDGEIK